MFTMSEDFQRYLDLLENSFLGFIKVVFIPFLPWLIPTCCFTGTILTFCIFEKHLEWSSLQACSISPFAIAGTFLFLSLAISILQFIFSSSLSRSTYEKNDSIKTGFKMEMGNKSSWYFQSFNYETFEGKNLQIYLYDEKGNDSLRIRCEKASWDKEDGWNFHNGVYLSFNTIHGLPVPNHKNQNLDWLKENKDNILSDEGSGKTPLRKLHFSDLKLKELNENQLPHLLLSEKPKNLL